MATSERARRGNGAQTSLVPAYQNAALVLSGPGVALTPGVMGAGWMGPGQPLPPMAPPEVEGRTFDFPVAWNMQQRTRPYEAVSFAQLRALADNYDLLRLCIETIKDRVCQMAWQVRPRRKVKRDGAMDARCTAIEAALAKPDKVRPWAMWLRMIVEDLLVLDAPAIYRRKTKGGAPYAFKALDGGTIERLLDDWGDTPAPPAPAYVQILKGVGAVHYRADQLIYMPRNPRTHKAFGFGPVEQVITLVNIGLRRQTWQLNYFTDGNLPDALIGVPNEWTPAQIQAFQDWFDARLQGSSARRRGATFVAGDVAKGYVATKETELFGKGEEWLARVVCYCLGLSPQPFVQMMNRATAGVAQTSSEEEGTGPIKAWVKLLLDSILADDFAAADLEFWWEEEEEVDQGALSTMLIGEVNAGVRTRDEARQVIGLDVAGGSAAELMVTTASGPVPVDFDSKLEQTKAMFEATPKPAPGAGPGASGESSGPGRPGQGGRAGAGPEKAEVPAHVEKVAGPTLTIDRAAGRRAVKALAKAAAAALSDTADDVAGQVVRMLREANKAAPPKAPSGGSVGPAGSGGIIDVDGLVERIDLSSLDVMVDGVEAALHDIAADTALKALASVGVAENSDLVDVVDQEAVAWARSRAAELVGKRWTPEGELIDNPNAKYAIDQATREALRETIATGLETNVGTPGIADMIQAAYAFSAERADLIARTEVSRANEQSKLNAWREAAGAGVSLKKRWLTANDDSVDLNICLENQAQGPVDLDADFQSGDDAPPGHPNCRCVLVSDVEE